MLQAGRRCGLLISFVVASLLGAQELSISTLAGSTSGGGWIDGKREAARFSYPQGIAIDSMGIVYVADSANHVIRRIAPDGTVSTIAGAAGVSGSSDGPAEAARFNRPTGVGLGANGILYVCDSANHVIRTITSTGVVSTLAGLAGTAGTSDGSRGAARFTYPRGLEVDSSGNLVVADTSNHTIRKVTPEGVVTTIAGQARSSGSSDGFGSQARFNFPFDVAVGPGDMVYVADTENHTIRRVSPEGHVSTLAGTPENDVDSPGSRDGIGTAARFNYPWSIDVDRSGNVYVADTWNHSIRHVTPALTVTTLAGVPGVVGNRDDAALLARFHAPSGIVVQDDGTLFVSDRYNHVVRKISTLLAVTTIAGSPPHFGTVDAKGPGARFFFPDGIAFDMSGNLVVAGPDDVIRRVAPDGSTATIAGLANTEGATDGLGSSARFNSPWGLTFDANGNIVLTDFRNSTVRRVSPAGIVTTLAGLAGAVGDEIGSGSQARFDHPIGVAADGLGNVFVADSYNHRIKMIDVAGVVTNFAGSSYAGKADGIGASASFRYPTGISLDAARNIYVADWGNHTIRKITPSGQVTTVAGTAGSWGFLDATGPNARFNYPRDVAALADGTLYVADTDNHVIRRVSPSGVVTTVAGLPATPGNVDGIGRGVRFFFPYGIALDAAGHIAVTDTYNHAVRTGTAAPPTVLSFTATPTSLAHPGAVTLTWTTVNASTVSISDIGAVPVSGTRSVTVPNTTRFTLTATGAGGTTAVELFVTVGMGRRRAVRP